MKSSLCHAAETFQSAVAAEIWLVPVEPEKVLAANLDFWMRAPVLSEPMDQSEHVETKVGRMLPLMKDGSESSETRKTQSDLHPV